MAISRDSNLIIWARAQRAIMEQNAKALVEAGATDREIVEMAVAFPYYKQEAMHEVGEICRDPETEQLKRCVTAYDGSVQTAWTIEDGTLWYAYHGVNKETAYPFVQPTGGHDVYKKGEYMTFEDKTYVALNDTAYSPTDYIFDWEVVE